MLKSVTNAFIWFFESFILQAILLAIALSITYLHVQQIWYNQSQNGWCRAVSMEIGVAWQPLLVALVVFILAGLSHYRQEKRRDKRDQLMLTVLTKIAKKLGADGGIDEE